jgi:hypothetical protein
VVKTKLETKKIVTIAPKASFVKKVVIDGTDVSVKLANNTSTYHYKLDKKTVSNLVKVAKSEGSIGTFFNKNLRGNSVARTRVTA